MFLLVIIIIKVENLLLFNIYFSEVPCTLLNYLHLCRRVPYLSSTTWLAGLSVNTTAAQSAILGINHIFKIENIFLGLFSCFVPLFFILPINILGVVPTHLAFPHSGLSSVHSMFSMSSFSDHTVLIYALGCGCITSTATGGSLIS